MKKITVILSFMVAVAFLTPSANAGLISGAAKGIGKGAKSVGGCLDRGARGVGKGVKSTCGGIGKGIKSVF